jgi:class 3 adenylate cyclase
VILPVKRMIAILKEMASDPRLAIERATSSQKITNSNTEMHAIEACIGKFGGLLKVGFGEAGMGIIARNLKAHENFDPVVPGVIVKAVFGFCDIRNFTDCCEVLNEDTMIFTNGIASIVHDLVEGNGGTVNKNIGDAFLSVWKLRDDEKPDGESVSSQQVRQPSDGSQAGTATSAALSQDVGAGSQPTSKQSAAESQDVSSAASKLSDEHLGLRRRRSSFSHHITGALDTCDGALKSFLQMNEMMRTSEKIQELAEDPRLQKKLPGYTVRMGSGLHLGWAIEGAVGTSHKVDATYLSPHVNMAARLEAATKQYGVKILMSDAFVVGLTQAFYAECRPIDKVTVKGSQKPIILYVHMPSEATELTTEQCAHFLDLWCQAFSLYLSGSDWRQAADVMQKCLEILPRDEPAKVLLRVIENRGGKAPEDWPGYRALTSK